MNLLEMIKTQPLSLKLLNLVRAHVPINGAELARDLGAQRYKVMSDRMNTKIHRARASELNRRFRVVQERSKLAELKRRGAPIDESLVTHGILREAELSGIQQFAGAADDILPLWNKLHKPVIAGGGIYIGGKYVGRRKNNQYVPPSDDEDDSYFKMSAAPSRVGRTELMESRRIA